MRSHAFALAILLGHFLVFLFLNRFINPHPDMLDHWVWSLYPALSYYEHPPMVAWAIRLVTLIGGDSEIVLEVGAQFYNLSILALAYAICFHLFGRRAAIIFLILLESTPYYFLGSAFLHIDQPFLIFWLLNLFCLCRFHQTQDFRWLLAIGVLAGLGALSKYITILFYLGLFVHLLVYPSCRRHLLNPWLYVAGVISLIVFTPVIIWNYQHDWVSFRFQFGRGLTGSPGPENFVAFTFGHLFLFSLIWSGWSFFTLWKHRSEFKVGTQPQSILLVLAICPLLFFSLMSFRGSIADPHWANVFYLSVMMFVGKKLAEAWETKQRTRIRGLLIAGVALNAICTVLVFMHINSPLIEWPQYRLKYDSSLSRNGMPADVIERLDPLRGKVPERKQEFLSRVSSLLNEEEFERYEDLILKASLAPAADVVTNFIAWEKTALQLQHLLEAQNLYPPDYIITKEFQLASALTFFMPTHPAPHSIEKPERNEWSPVEDVRLKNAIVLCRAEVCRRVFVAVEQRFGRTLRYLGDVTTESHGRIVRQLEVYGWAAE